MMDKKIAIFFLVFSFLLLGLSSFSNKKTVNVEFLKNYDGDTITVKIAGKKEKVRFLDIDVFEMCDANKNRKAKATEARNYVNKKLRTAKKVWIFVKTDPQNNMLRDTYHRILAQVYYIPKNGKNPHLLNREVAKWSDKRAKQHRQQKSCQNFFEKPSSRNHNKLK